MHLFYRFIRFIMCACFLLNGYPTSSFIMKPTTTTMYDSIYIYIGTTTATTVAKEPSTININDPQHLAAQILIQLCTPGLVHVRYFFMVSRYEKDYIMNMMRNMRLHAWLAFFVGRFVYSISSYIYIYKLMTGYYR
jgi:hypothetical protein